MVLTLSRYLSQKKKKNLSRYLSFIFILFNFIVANRYSLVMSCIILFQTSHRYESFFFLSCIQCFQKKAKDQTSTLVPGQNGQIPSILKIFCKKTLFPKKIVIYHFFWYSSLVGSSTIFFNPPWHDDMESWIKKIKNWPLSTRAYELEYCSLKINRLWDNYNFLCQYLFLFKNNFGAL